MERIEVIIMKKRIGYACVVMLLAVIFIRTNVKITLWALLLSVGALGLVILINQIVYKSVKIKYEIIYDRKKSKSYVQITPVNKSIFPANHIENTIKCDNAVFGSSESVKFDISVGARKKTKAIKIPLNCKYCGRVDIKVEECKIYDWFDITYRTKKVNVGGFAYFYPDESETYLAELNDTVSEGEELTYKHVVGNDVSEILQIREYRIGDNIKNIHWNLSAATDGKLLVKELDTPNDNSIMIVMDYAADSDKETNNRIIGRVFDVSRLLLEENMGHTIYRMDTQKNAVAPEKHISSMNDYDDEMKVVLETYANSNEKSVAEYIMCNGINQQYAKIIYVRPKNMRDDSGIDNAGNCLVMEM